MQLSINSRGLNKLVLRLEGMQREMLPAVADGMETIGTWLTNRLREDAPRGENTDSPPGDAYGPLSSSFSYTVTRTTNAAKVVVRTNQPTKLKYVRKGTGIYGPRHRRIVPTTAKALYWKGARHPVKSVSGEKPNDFVTPRLEDVKQVAQQVLERAVKQVIEYK